MVFLVAIAIFAKTKKKRMKYNLIVSAFVALVIMLGGCGKDPQPNHDNPDGGLQSRIGNGYGRHYGLFRNIHFGNGGGFGNVHNA